MSQVLFIENDNAVVLNALRDLDGNYINSATVTLESLVDRATGAAVTGITPPVSMPYVAASNGVYRALLPHTLGLTLGKYYRAKVKVVSGTMDGVWYEDLVCRLRATS